MESAQVLVAHLMMVVSGTVTVYYLHNSYEYISECTSASLNHDKRQAHPEQWRPPRRGKKGGKELLQSSLLNLGRFSSAALSSCLCRTYFYMVFAR